MTNRTVHIWEIFIGPNWGTDEVYAKTIDEAIAKCRRHNGRLFRSDMEIYIESVKLKATSDY